MRHRRAATTVALAAGVVLGAGLAGCGSSGSTATRASAPTTTPAPARTTTTSPTTTLRTSGTTTSGTTMRSTAGAGSQPASCAAAELSVDAAGESEAGGQYMQTLVLTNHGTAACVLDGWPGVQAVDSTGTAEPTTTTRVRQTTAPAPAYRPVTLGVGGTASFDVFGPDFNTVDDVAYPKTSALLVIPPNTTSQLRVAVALPDSRYFDVSPVVAGSSDHTPYAESASAG